MNKVAIWPPDVHQTPVRGGSVVEPPLTGGSWSLTQEAGGDSTCPITNTVAFAVGMLPQST